MNLYIIGIYLLVMSVCIGFLDLIYFIPLFIVLFIAIIGFYDLEKREKILYLIIAAIFLVRVVTGVNFYEYRAGDRVEVLMRSGVRSSVVSKIDNKLPRRNLYIDGNTGRSGNYRVVGDIVEKNITRGRTIFKLRSYEKTEVKNSLVRRYLDKRIEAMLKGYSYDLKEFYRGIILGEKDGLDRELKDKFSYTGTSHLIVISGLHIGVIIALMMYVATKLPISHDVRYIGVIIVLSLYVLAVGGSPSVTRAYIMGMCYLGGGLFYEESEGKRSLLLALIINLLIDPLGGTRISFQLSYTAVFTILFIYPYYEKKIKMIENKPLRWIVTMGSLSLAIQLALTPVFMMNFRSIPLFSFLVNIVAIPLGVVFVQGAFLALLLSNLGLGRILISTVNLLYYLLIGFIEWAAGLPLLSVEYTGVTRVWYPLIIYLGMYLFFNKKTRTLSLIPLVIIVMLNRERTTDYVGDGYVYYYPKVLVAHRKLSLGDIDEIWDNRIKNSLLISPKVQDENIIKKLRVDELIVLEDEEGLKVGNRSFRNIDGTIRLE